MRRERQEHTLGATALVHEAYLRLVQQTEADAGTRLQFFGIAARVMRQVLVDHARARAAAKRGKGQQPLRADTSSLIEQAPDPTTLKDGSLIALDDALNSLASIDPQKSQVVELRFFGGLSVEETAQYLGISSRSVAREWVMAKTWLYTQTRPGGQQA